MMIILFLSCSRKTQDIKNINFEICMEYNQQSKHYRYQTVRSWKISRMKILRMNHCKINLVRTLENASQIKNPLKEMCKIIIPIYIPSITGFSQHGVRVPLCYFLVLPRSNDKYLIPALTSLALMKILKCQMLKCQILNAKYWNAKCICNIISSQWLKIFSHTGPHFKFNLPSLNKNILSKAKRNKNFYSDRVQSEFPGKTISDPRSTTVSHSHS
jgi:hypothetical protein